MTPAASDDAADLVIVGAGHAGVQLISALTKQGYSGSVVLISDEPEYPYQRPPLSKGYLKGSEHRDSLKFREPDYWENGPVRLLRGVQVRSIDAPARIAKLDDGRRISYSNLVWAAGGRARRLSVPGAMLDNVFQVRSIADADEILKSIVPTSRVVVIGGGYIGLEAAASLNSRGLDVTVLETADRLLARVTSPAISAFFKQLHEAHGVTIVVGARVQAIIGTPEGLVTAVTTEDGTTYPADIVIAGIGLVPCVEVPQAAGCEIADGVVVDGTFRTSDPHIFAIGDCARCASSYSHAGASLRIESIPNATEHAQLLAATLCGSAPIKRAVPWFWSDQYDIKFKTAGLMHGHDQVVVRGDSNSAMFSVAYLNQGRLIALDAVNATTDFAHAKLLISDGAMVDPQLMADSSIKLKDTVLA